jgi:hypothetical protein
MKSCLKKLKRGDVLWIDRLNPDDPPIVKIVFDHYHSSIKDVIVQLSDSQYYKDWYVDYACVSKIIKRLS